MAVASADFEEFFLRFFFNLKIKYVLKCQNKFKKSFELKV